MRATRPTPLAVLTLVCALSALTAPAAAVYDDGGNAISQCFGAYKTNCSPYSTNKTISAFLPFGIIGATVILTAIGVAIYFLCAPAPNCYTNKWRKEWRRRPQCCGRWVDPTRSTFWFVCRPLKISLMTAVIVFAGLVVGTVYGVYNANESWQGTIDAVYRSRFSMDHDLEKIYWAAEDWYGFSWLGNPKYNITTSKTRELHSGVVSRVKHGYDTIKDLQKWSKKGVLVLALTPLGISMLAVAGALGGHRKFVNACAFVLVVVLGLEFAINGALVVPGEAAHGVCNQARDLVYELSDTDNPLAKMLGCTYETTPFILQNKLRKARTQARDEICDEMSSICGDSACDNACYTHANLTTERFTLTVNFQSSVMTLPQCVAGEDVCSTSGLAQLHASRALEAYDDRVAFDGAVFATNRGLNCSYIDIDGLESAACSSRNAYSGAYAGAWLVFVYTLFLIFVLFCSAPRLIRTGEPGHPADAGDDMHANSLNCACCGCCRCCECCDGAYDPLEDSEEGLGGHGPRADEHTALTNNPQNGSYAASMASDGSNFNFQGAPTLHPSAPPNDVYNYGNAGLTPYIGSGEQPPSYVGHEKKSSEPSAPGPSAAGPSHLPPQDELPAYDDLHR